MCAIFGFYNPEFPRGFNRGRLLRHLARKCQVYGDKSFGLYTSSKPRDIEKYTGSASAWIQSKKPAEIEAFAKSNILLGHTRWPSHGAVTKANCHPFFLDPWVACHNGCISNSGELMLKAKLAPKGETDSEETLAYIVSKNWSKESMGEIRGGFAFGGIKKDLTEGILVCDDRQRLHYVKLGAGYAWCTDGSALVSSLEAAGMDISGLEVKRLYGQILHLHTGVLEDLGAKHVELSRYEQQELEGTQTGGRGWANVPPGTWGEDDDQPKNGSRKAGQSRFSLPSSQHPQSVLRVPHFTSTPLDLSIGRKLREEAAAEQEDIAAGFEQAHLEILQREIREMKAESQDEELDQPTSDTPPELFS
jgi:hypothetical protein